jgi:hypothetical protein
LIKEKGETSRRGSKSLIGGVPKNLLVMYRFPN